MNRRVIRILGPLFGLLLFSTALWVLHHQLKAFHVHNIVHSLHALSGRSLFFSVSLTIVGYLIMTGYDTLALRYIRHSLSYSKIALASFIGYAFSNNIGLSMIAGASVRYRLYSSWGLTALEITRIVAFCTVTLWLGFFAVEAIVFLADPPALSAALRLPFTSVRLFGMFCTALVLGVFAASFVVRRPFKVKGWELSLPSPGLLFAQVCVASLDWALAGAVLYSLLPSISGFTYAQFIGLFLLAQLMGLLSQVPGGLGVFDTAMVMLLSPHLPASETVGSLLAYRVIYYIIPLLWATLLLGVHEILQKKESIRKAVHAIGRRGSAVIPQVMALSTFVGGAVLLFSGATPAVDGRLRWLNDVIPLPILELSHFLGSLVGGALLLLARGLQRRLDAAYVLTALLLAAGIVLSLLKGLDYEEAIVLSVMLLGLLPCRRYFYRSASLFRVGFSPAWIVGIVGVLLSSVWLGFFCYKHVEYSNDLWWRFTLFGNASRFLRAGVGVMAVVVFWGTARILSPAPPRASGFGEEEPGSVSEVVRNCSDGYAYLALLGDKSFLWSESRNAFIMYGVEGRSWVSMGNPVGPPEEWPELIWEFRRMVDRFAGWAAFYEVSTERLHLYLDVGLSLIKLGEEARVSLEGFSLEGSARKGLRYAVHKVEREGCVFEIVSEEDVASILPELEGVSSAWLMEKNTGEKGFSLGFFNPEYLKQLPVAVVRQDGKITAFANVWPGGTKEELSVDLMRYTPEAPRGVMDYLFSHLMLWGKAEGYQWFNLGMAPLSGLIENGPAPFWSRVGAYVFRHGEHFYNFQGLRQYKEKFDPVWRPKYLACPGGPAVPRILINIAALVSGGLKEVVAK